MEQKLISIYMKRIQIQHLLKLNITAIKRRCYYYTIQIQHLLKLNCVLQSLAVCVLSYSNTTLVKVKC